MNRDPTEDPQPGDVVKYYPQTITITKRTIHMVHFKASPPGAFETEGKIRLFAWRQTMRWEERAMRELIEKEKEQAAAI